MREGGPHTQGNNSINLLEPRPPGGAPAGVGVRGLPFHTPFARGLASSASNGGVAKPRSLERAAETAEPASTVRVCEPLFVVNPSTRLPHDGKFSDCHKLFGQPASSAGFAVSSVGVLRGSADVGVHARCAAGTGLESTSSIPRVSRSSCTYRQSRMQATTAILMTTPF